MRPIFSLMLISSQEGVLSVGGTGAHAVDLVKKETHDELDHVSLLEREVEIPIRDDESGATLVKRGVRGTKGVLSRQAGWEDGWTWSKVQGAEGWWQILMQAVWVDGSKVLQNQAVVVDVSALSLIQGGQH